VELIAYLSKDGVLLIKPIAAVKGNEELTIVGMRSSCIGTSDHTAVIESQTGMNLVSEWPSIDGISTCSKR